MTYTINQKQFDQVTSLSAEKRYAHFISKVADWEELWTLKGREGFVLFGDFSGHECIPVWPHPDYAKALMKGDWSDCTPEKLNLSIFLERWIPSMIKDKRMVAVFPTPNEKGIVVNPQILNEDFAKELEQYE